MVTAVKFQSSTASALAPELGFGAAYDVGPAARIISTTPSMTSSERILMVAPLQ
jgi:hypothetical protein